MCNQECDRESLVFRIEQLQLHQQGLAKYIAAMERRLDDLSERFKNRFEQKPPADFQDDLTQLHGQPDVFSALPAAPVEVQSHEYQLVFDRSGSRAVLIEALLKAQNRLIIVCPWLSRNSIDADLMQKFKDCLNRKCRIDIGWGYLSGRDKIGKGWGNSAIRDLKELERDYPKQFKLKLLGTHEKFLVCDDSFAMLGSHNMLSSNARGVTREVGIRTTDPQIIQGLIDRFDGAEVQNAQAIDENLAAVSVNLDEVELDEDEDTDDSVEYSQSPAIDAKEFLRRYNEKERDFIRVNLSGANLSGKTFETDAQNNEVINLNEANLSGTNLSKTKLRSASFLEANLNKANLSEALLCAAKFTAADLSGANLMQANLSYANLAAADLSGAILTAANLSDAILTAANLSKAQLRNAQFSKTNLSGANLSKAQLGNAQFSKTNLSGANLTGVNLVGVTFKDTDLSGATLAGAKLCGANFNGQHLSGVNLTKADLRGAELSFANLEKANLKEANMSGASLSGAKLSGAIMPDGTVHD